MTSELNDTQRKLAADNIDLARYLADVAHRKMNSRASKDEVLSAAYHGLVIASKNYDPQAFDRSQESIDDGTAFSSYARQRILGSILDWQRSQDHVPRRQRKMYKDAQSHGYEEGVPLEDISALMNVPVSRLKSVVARVGSSPVSINSSIGFSSDSSEFDISDPEDVQSSSLVINVSKATADCWWGLEANKRLIVALRYYGELEFSSIASMLDVSILEVKKLHDSSIVEIHKAMFMEIKEKF